MTTREEIRTWLLEGKEQGATHTIIACDTFDYSDFPVHIMPGEDVRKKESELDKVMEVYSHAVDHETQLSETRSWHYETAEVVTSQAKRFFVTSKGKRVDGEHLLALNARQSDTISGLASENQALRQGVVCYVVGRLESALVIDNSHYAITSPGFCLLHVQASRDEASKVPWFNENADVGQRALSHVNIFQTKPMATYELALEEAAAVYKRDFSRIAERLPMHHKGKPYVPQEHKNFYNKNGEEL